MARLSLNVLRRLARLAVVGQVTGLLALPAFGLSDCAPQSQQANAERVVTEQCVQANHEGDKTRSEYAQASPLQTQTPQGQKLNTDDGTKLLIDVYTGNDSAR